MRRRSFHTPHPPGRINVTPMIDVVMVLIVFYLIVGRLVAEQRSEVYLPESRTGAVQKTQDLLVVNVLARDTEGPAPIEVEGVNVSPALLTSLVRDRLAEKPTTVVQVRADRELTYADVLPVIRACRLAGVGHVRISAEQAPGAP
jgi:biopolymer transport protein ExbD